MKAGVSLVALISQTVKLRQNGSEWQGLCPWHADTKPSLSINEDKGLWLCHGCGVGGSAYDWMMRRDGVDFTEAKRLLDDPPAEERRVVATYDYTDSEGKVLFQVLRYQPKAFSQRRPDGKGGWVANLRGVEPVLYNLPAVVKAEVVYVVEGEKDANRLIAEGLVATTAPGGAGKWKPQYSQALQGKKVIVIPDNDAEGEKHATLVATALKGVASEVLVCRLPELPHKGDVSDWLDQGHQAGDLEQHFETPGADTRTTTTLTENNPQDPEITPRPGGYEFYWPDSGIYIRLERVREHHDTISAELWAEHGPDRQHLTGFLRVSLATPGGRASIVKTLEACLKGVPWRGMVEQACVYTGRKLREQDAFTHIGHLPVDQDLRFLLAPVTPEGVTTLLFGYGDLGKTTLAYTWGLLIQTGETRLGLTPKQGPVMLLDWETNKGIANNVQRSIHAGMGLPGVNPDFIYRRCRRPLVEFVEDVKAEAEREGVALIIMDSFIKACGGEKETKENALPTLNALDWIGKTNLVISHRPKGEEGKDRGAYGSVMIENDVRQAFRLEGRHNPEEGAAQVALFHTKHNLMAPLKPFGYRITWDKLVGTRVETQEVATMEGLKEKLYTVAQIQAVFNQDRPTMTVEEIAKATGLTETNVAKTLARHTGKRFTPVGSQPSAGGRPAVLWGRMTLETPENFR